MRIGLEEIDPQIAEAIFDRLCAQPNEFLKDNIRWGGFNPIPFSWEFHSGGLKVRRKRDPSEDEREAYKIRKSREEQFAARAMGAAFIPCLAGTAVGWSIATASPVAGFISGVGVWAAATAAGAVWTRRASPRQRLTHSIQISELRAVLPMLTLTRGERVYCDAILLLARIETSPDLEGSLRETLIQLNHLLDSSRRLEARRLSLLPLMGAHAVPELEAEYGALGRRLDQSTDAITRQMLERSLEMCGSRLENARAFGQGLERLNAQQEAIIHTISSALSQMARMQIISDPQAELAAQEIAETVTQMSQQTHAVEQAVQEVMSLRT